MFSKPLTLRHIRCAWLAGVMALSTQLVACTPSYNWRLVSHEGVAANMLMPCKPERAQREIPLMGPEAPLVALSMLSCDVQGQRFAWAVVRLPEGADPRQVLVAWRQANWAALKQTLPDGEQAPADWELMPASASAEVRERWRGPARNHMDQPLEAHLQWQASGGWMHQAGVYGSGVDTDTLRTFFDSFSSR